MIRSGFDRVLAARATGRRRLRRPVRGDFSRCRSSGCSAAATRCASKLPVGCVATVCRCKIGRVFEALVIRPAGARAHRSQFRFVRRVGNSTGAQL